MVLPEVLLEVGAQVLAVEMIQNLEGFPPWQYIPGYLK